MGLSLALGMGKGREGEEVSTNEWKVQIQNS